MLPLLVQIVNKETHATVEAGFRRSPVRLGRNALNDLALDESFVSQWHGIIWFDEEGTRFLDLGSTNGTKLDGNRLEKNTEVDVTAETHLAIGPLRMTFARVAIRDDQVLSRRASAFNLGGTTRAQMGVGEGGTLEIASMSGANGAFGATLAEGGASPKQALIEMANRQKQLIEQLKPLYAAFEAAETSLKGAMDAGVNAAPNAEEREVRLSLLQAQFPKAFASGGAASAEGSGSLLERLAPGAEQTWSEPEAAVERVGAVLEAFASAYVDLQDGQKQVRGDLGLETQADPSGLPRFSDSRELLRYLLDGQSDAMLRLDELARSFADLAVHQLGMVAGSVEGALSVRQQVSPQAIGAVTPGAIVKTGMGLGDFVWPSRPPATTTASRPSTSS
ncbi:MAG: FHA domain-containing protein [Sandaracinaceae bacterium]